MKNAIIILTILVFGCNNQLLSAQSPPTTATTTVDSMDIKANLKKLDEKISEIKDLSKKAEKTEKERHSILERLKRFITWSKYKSNDTATKEAKIEYVRVALKPNEYDTVKITEKDILEQRPKTFFGRLFSKEKFRYFLNDSTEVKRKR